MSGRGCSIRVWPDELVQLSGAGPVKGAHLRIGPSDAELFVVLPNLNEGLVRLRRADPYRDSATSISGEECNDACICSPMDFSSSLSAPALPRPGKC